MILYFKNHMLYIYIYAIYNLFFLEKKNTKTIII